MAIQHGMMLHGVCLLQILSLASLVRTGAGFLPSRSHYSAPPPRPQNFRLKVSNNDPDGGNDSITNIVIEEEDVSLRFSGVGRLFNNEEQAKDSTSTEPHLDIVERLGKSTVSIVGIGGVGSWAAEAICRSGVGNIILVDLDDICTSNINRQLHAMSSTVGKMKIDVMKERLLDINPTCNVTVIHDFISVDNAKDLVEALSSDVDVMLDCIDGHFEKTALIAAACLNNLPIVTCGGAAGRVDPTKIVCGDLSKASQCRLLFWCKKRLRDQYKLFPKGPSDPKLLKKHRVRKWKIWAVYSEEVQKTVDQSKDNSQTSSLRRCDGALGTACFVTGTYGFVAASKVISMIANQELIEPKILNSGRKIAEAKQDDHILDE
mmetsp:Transcript_11944/g.17470  ORF Transcript_11944/g.17470 Transcript_11944/m.17470 type:complete len:376 (-) Transcript_11944:177-1304(-)